jgi:hypothetical protein
MKVFLTVIVQKDRFQIYMFLIEEAGADTLRDSFSNII